GAWISAFPCLQVPAGQTGNDEIYPLTSTMSQKLNPGFLPAGQAGPIKSHGNDGITKKDQLEKRNKPEKQVEPDKQDKPNRQEEGRGECRKIKKLR
ncbi:MAG TPA: hypothetical protein VGB26_09665, partial [Nitrospiria bacterium]